MYRVILIFVLLLPVIATAQTKIDSTKGITIGGGTVFALANASARSGIGGSGYFCLKLNKQIGIKVSSGYYQSDVIPVPLSSGDYSMGWADVGIQVSGRHSTLRPYAGTGIGYCLVGHEVDKATLEYVRVVEGKILEESVDNAFCFYLNGGVDFPIWKKLLAKIELKYFRLRPTAMAVLTNIKNNTTETIEEKIDFDTVILTVGVVVEL